MILEVVWIDVRGGAQMERWDLWMFCVAGAATCGRRGVREESRRTPQDKQRPKNGRGGGVPANHVNYFTPTPDLKERPRPPV